MLSCAQKILFFYSPITHVWHGGVKAFQYAEMTKEIATKELYDEHSSTYFQDKFDTLLCYVWSLNSWTSAFHHHNMGHAALIKKHSSYK